MKYRVPVVLLIPRFTIYRLLTTLLLIGLIIVQYPSSLHAQRDTPDSVLVSGAGWANAFGTSTDDLLLDLAVSPAGIAYVAGVTQGKLGEQAYGEDDAWFAAIDEAGTQLWLQQLGTAATDSATAVAVGENKQIYLAGVTQGQLGEQLFGGADAWLAAYRSTGEQLWLRQIGNAGDDRIERIAVAEGQIVVVGSQTDTAQANRDGWIAAFDDKGNPLWSQTVQTSGDDQVFRVAIGSEQLIYVAGITGGQLGATHYGQADGWVAAYTVDGQQLWLEQIGNTGYDGIHNLAVDPQGNVYVVGSSQNSADHRPDAAPLGGWLVGFAANGRKLYDEHRSPFWLQNLDPGLGETITALAIDANNTLYVTGASTDLLGYGIAEQATWYAAFDLGGRELWLETYEIGPSTIAARLVVDQAGHLYMAGLTKGSIRGENQGKFDAWVTRLGPSAKQTLAIPHYATAPLAENTEKIIFHVGAVMEGAHHLASMSPTGGAATALVPALVTNTSYAPLISPDGTLIINGIADLHGLSVDQAPVFDLDGDVVKTFELHGTTIIPRSWSADGKSLLFAIFNGTHFADLYKVDYESGKSTNLTKDDAQSLFADWSPDGQQIAYMSDYQLWVMQADGSAKRRLIEQQARNLAWSPDGQYIAFESAPSGAYEDFDIWLVAADGTGLRNLSATPDWVESTPVWSPDSQQIIYTSGAGQLYIFDLPSGAVRQLTQRKGDHEALAWLPTQSVTPTTVVMPAQNTQSLRKLAFTKDNNLYTIDEDGSGLRNLTNREAAEMQTIPYAWSDDGRQIACLLDGDIYLIDVETGAQQKLSSGLDASLIDWHDTFLAVLRHVADPTAVAIQFRLAYLDVTQPQQITDLAPKISILPMGSGADARLAWSPDGQWLAYSVGTAGGVVNLNGNAVTDQIGYHPAWQQQAPRLVNLGQTWLAQDHTPGIWLFDPTTRQNHQLLELPAHYVAYSPDDRTIAYADPYLKRMTSAGGDQTLLTEDRALTPAWSPTGDALAYVRWVPGEGPWPVPAGLFIINADGTDRHQLVDGYAQEPSWQPRPGGTALTGAPLPIADATTPVTNTATLTNPSPAIQAGEVLSTPQSVPTATPTANIAPLETTGYVTAEKLNVRAGPSIQAAVLQQLSEGNTVTIIEKSSDGQWLQIVVAGSQQGWVAAQYIRLSAASADLTATATPRPTPACDVATDPRLQARWQQTALGCPTSRAALTWAGWQPFEHGFMIWREDQKVIYHFSDQQQWQAWPDRWSGTAATNRRGNAPAGLQAPVRGFGAIWEREDSVFAALGWAKDGEKGFCLLTQPFEHGLLFQSIHDNSCANGLYNHAQESGFPFQAAKVMHTGNWSE